MLTPIFFFGVRAEHDFRVSLHPTIRKTQQREPSSHPVHCLDSAPVAEVLHKDRLQEHPGHLCLNLMIATCFTGHRAKTQPSSTPWECSFNALGWPAGNVDSNLLLRCHSRAWLQGPPSSSNNNNSATWTFFPPCPLASLVTGQKHSPEHNSG